MSFDSLGLSPVILAALNKAGFTEPTPVQTAAIPKAIDGQDLIVSAQTGSGKTAAFMLPSLNRIAGMPANKGVGVQVLVLTPTRELALQVAEATKSYGVGIDDLRVATVVGGMPYGAQIKALSRRVDVLVATPGRLIDHLNARRVNLSRVHTLVLDEADRMLDMGFIEDIESIVSQTPADRQTLMFSATFEGTVARLAADMLNNPQRIDIAGQKQKHANITQTLLYADDSGHKLRLLGHVLRDASMDQAIVFTSTKRGADALAERLEDEGFAASALHGDMNQRQRTRTLGMLQKGRLRVLVATDVAARGIDVQGISHAINFDLPMQAEDYVHRIGRTGRAGRNGQAFTLATHGERHKIRRIEQFTGQPMPAEVIAGLEPVKSAESGRGAGGGKGRGGKPSSSRQGRPNGGSREKDHARTGFGHRKGGSAPSYGAREDSRSGEGRPERARPAKSYDSVIDRAASSLSRNPFVSDRPRTEKSGFVKSDAAPAPRKPRSEFAPAPSRNPRPSTRSDGGFSADRAGRSDKPGFSRSKKKPGSSRAWV